MNVKSDAKTESTIKQIRYGIKKAMHEGLYYELENILNHLCLDESDTGESNKIYQDLQQEIVHAQICVAEHFKFKRDAKEAREKAARLDIERQIAEQERKKNPLMYKLANANSRTGQSSGPKTGMQKLGDIIR